MRARYAATAHGLLRILYVTPAYKPSYRIGGPIRSISSAAEKIAMKGHEVTVVTTNANLDQEVSVPLFRSVNVEGVRVWYFPRTEPLQKLFPFVPYVSRSMGFLYSPSLRRHLELEIPAADLVHTQMPFVYPTLAAGRAAFRYRIPLFYSQRGNYDPAHLQFRALKKKIYISLFERSIMKNATTLIALTETERASFREVAPSTPIEIVPNGVDVPRPRPDAPERIRRRFGIPTDAQVILFLGRLHPIKGAEKILESFLVVAPKHPNAFLIMAGPDEWRVEEHYREYVAAAGLSSRVVFAGMVEGEEKADILARADLLSLPSIGEGFSMAVLEGLASETAVMISPGCNFPEVEEAGAGVVVERAHIAMVTALEGLLSSSERLSVMGRAGRRLVEQHYSWDVITDRMLEVYARGMERHATAGGRRP